MSHKEGYKKVTQIYSARPTSDGGGVKLYRLIGGSSIGGPKGSALDPFLMLDEFNTDNADDYIAGFPSHPHRGFETVTYMLEGNMLHQDHLGNQGLLQSGDVQWMTAARGIIHSEMPQQVAGKMQGFQLWINLPATEKMKTPAYQDIKSEQIPVIDNNNYRIKVIAGDLELFGRQYQGAVQGVSTQPLYLDLHFNGEQSLELPIPEEHTALIYVYNGEFTIGDTRVSQQHMAKLSMGERLQVKSLGVSSKALVLAAKPLKEPVVQRGPFVMNTMEEIEQAIADYRAGRLTD